MSRLGLGLGITKGGVIPFNPLSLDPYLLFDTQSSMIGTFENPTLDLDPSVPSTLDVITASRSGVATYTDADGLIQSATPNTVRVDYTQGAELTPTVYQYFQTDFSSVYWTERDSTITSGFSSPDGGNNAFKLVASQANGDVFASVASGNSHTKVVSVFAKANTATSKLRIQEQNYTGKRTEFDLNLGTITYSNSSGTSTIENVGDGWYRCAHVETYSSGQNTVAFAVRSVTADSLFLFGPQAEEGTTPTTFVANTTGSAKFITGATFGPRVPMILVEPSATNTIRWSEDSTAYNYGSGITFETSDVLAPDGQASAFKITPDGSTSTHRRGSSYSGFYDEDDVVTMSVWLKTDGYDYFLRVGGFFGAESALFDSLDGSVQSTEGNVISASSEDYGNGWFRYKVTYTFQNTINNRYLYAGVRLVKRDASNNPVESFDGTGETTGVLVYGTQFELGSLATSYIPTDNDVSGVTRAADDLSIDPDSTNHITNTDFSTWGTQNITVSSGGGFSGYPSSVITATGTGNKFFTATLSGITAGQTHTGSIYIRRTNGSGRVDFVHPNSTSGSDSSNRTITTDWTRVTCQFNGSTSSGVVTQFQIRMFTAGDSLEIAMPQVELGSSPTGFIPTSGAPASRTTFSDFYNGSEGTFYLELVDRNPTIGVHSFLRGQDINRDFLVSNGAGTKMTSFDGSSFLVQDGLVIDQLSRAAVSYESGARSLSFNGSSPNDGGNNAINWASADRLQIGNGNTFIANMHVKRVIFWPYHKDNL